MGDLGDLFSDLGTLLVSFGARVVIFGGVGDHIGAFEGTVSSTFATFGGLGGRFWDSWSNFVGNGESCKI